MGRSATWMAVWALAVLVAMGTAGATPDEKKERIAKLELQRAEARYNFIQAGGSVNRIPPGLCAPVQSQNEVQCQWGPYVEGIFLVSVLAIVLLILTLPFCCCFFVARAFGFCGGNKRSHGCLRPGRPRDGPNDAYPTWSVHAIRAGLLGVFIMVLVGFAVVTSADNELEETVDGFLVTFDVQGRSLLDSARDLLNEVANLPVPYVDSSIGNYSIPQSAIPATRDALLKVQNAAREANKTVAEAARIFDTVAQISVVARDWNSVRHDLLLVFLVFALLLVIVGIVGGICCFPSLALCLAIGGFAVFALACASYVIHSALGTATNDSCLAFSDFLRAANGSSTSSGSVFGALASTAAVVEVFADCNSLTSYNRVNDLLTEVRNDGYNALCSFSVDVLCSIPYPCQPNMDCPLVPCDIGECTPDTLPLFFNLPVADASFGCVSSSNPPVIRNVTAGPEFSPRTTTPSWAGLANARTYISYQTPSCPVSPESCFSSGKSPLPCSNDPKSFSDCAANCQDPNLRALMAGYVNLTTTVLRYESVIRDKVLPFLSCGSVKLLLVATEDFVCVNAPRSFDNITSGLIVILVGYFFGIVLGILGSKRFTNTLSGSKAMIYKTMGSLPLVGMGPRPRKGSLEGQPGERRSKRQSRKLDSNGDRGSGMGSSAPSLTPSGSSGARKSVQVQVVMDDDDEVRPVARSGAGGQIQGRGDIRRSRKSLRSLSQDNGAPPLRDSQANERRRSLRQSEQLSPERYSDSRQAVELRPRASAAFPMASAPSDLAIDPSGRSRRSTVLPPLGGADASAPPMTPIAAVPADRRSVMVPMMAPGIVAVERLDGDEDD